MSVNKVILIGNLGKDPEVRYLESGTALATFPIATNENYKDRNTGEKKTDTQWHNIVMWRALAEIAEKYLKKGDQVFIEGKLTTRSYDDKEGNKKYITEVVAREMTMLGKSSASKGNNEGPPPPQQEPEGNYGSGEMSSSAVENNAEDDLPF